MDFTSSDLFFPQLLQSSHLRVLLFTHTLRNFFLLHQPNATGASLLPPCDAPRIRFSSMSSMLKTDGSVASSSPRSRIRSRSEPLAGEAVSAYESAANSLRAILTILDDHQDVSMPPTPTRPVAVGLASVSPGIRVEAHRRVEEWRFELLRAATGAIDFGVGSDETLGNSTRPSSPHVQSGACSSGWVHVLWDTETAGLPAELRSRPRGPHALRNFLARCGVLHKGASVGRFKLYFRPTVDAVCDPCLRDLDRAGFECVAALGRGTDAIHRLISDEMGRLCSGATEAERLRVLMSRVVDDVSGWATGGDAHVAEGTARWMRGEANATDGGSGGGGGGDVTGGVRAHATIVLVVGGAIDYASIIAAARSRGFRVVTILSDGPDGDRRAMQCVASHRPFRRCSLTL